MRWPARFRGDEGGYTLVELIIGMAIVGLLIGAIGSALIVTLRTTGVTNKRLSESHDVQLTSAYLANDVESASNIQPAPASGNCSGAFIDLVTFTFSKGGKTAIYKCGTATNGETQVTRTFNNGTPIVIAHFAGVARPDVAITYDPAHPTVPVSVTITFRKASDCTLDCTYTLFGSRRTFSSSTAGGVGSSPGNVVLLSTGTSSPLWVQGKCQDPGTILGSSCTAVDPSITSLPVTPDLQTTGWTVVPLYSKLNDQDPSTYVTSPLGAASEARVTMSSVNPPDTVFNPFVEFHASKVTGSAPKVILSIYDGSTTPPTLLTSTPANKAVGPINSTTPDTYDWQLAANQTSAIPASAYAHLVLGFKLSNPSSTDQIRVDGAAIDTASPGGLLTIKGPLYINSQLSTAVRLTGLKSGADATKISIINGDFQIWNPGACSGCDHNTVTCAACTWVGQQPWTSYSNSIPDPLKSLPAPNPASLPTYTSMNQGCDGAGVCSPGNYQPTFSRTSSPTTLKPGIYYLQQGMSITGNAALTCPTCTGGQGVLLYIAGGSVTFAGSSSINLPAASSGLYQNILMFQAHGLRSQVKIAGNSGSGTTNVLGGVVYVPDSDQVTLATGSASLTARAIVAQNIKVSSSVCIGPSPCP